MYKKSFLQPFFSFYGFIYFIINLSWRIDITLNSHGTLCLLILEVRCCVSLTSRWMKMKRPKANWCMPLLHKRNLYEVKIANVNCQNIFLEVCATWWNSKHHASSVTAAELWNDFRMQLRFGSAWVSRYTLVRQIAPERFLSMIRCIKHTRNTHFENNK